MLGLAGYLLASAFSRPALDPAAGNVIEIAADMGGFDRPQIRVKAGEAVTIRLTSLDNQFHIVFVLPLVAILVAASARPTLNRLAHWNLHHKEWVRLALGGGVVVMGLAILVMV